MPARFVAVAGDDQRFEYFIRRDVLVEQVAKTMAPESMSGAERAMPGKGKIAVQHGGLPLSIRTQGAPNSVVLLSGGNTHDPRQNQLLARGWTPGFNFCVFLTQPNIAIETYHDPCFTTIRAYSHCRVNGFFIQRGGARFFAMQVPRTPPTSIKR
jgi:hypothetical protein